MIYLDTCLVIYWVENHSIFAPQIEHYIAQRDTQIFAISHLVMSEVLVMPFRDNNTALLEKYKIFFANTEILQLSEAVFVSAAHLRADYPRLKTPDALHLATAQYHQCTQLWTNDGRLQQIVGDYAVNIFC